MKKNLLRTAGVCQATNAIHDVLTVSLKVSRILGRIPMAIDITSLEHSGKINKINKN